MCLWVLASRRHADYPFVFAGNRDELHRRPAEPAHWWPAPRMLAGRDLQAGGTWLGLDATGRFAVVTNFREPDPPQSGALSRGALVRDWFAAQRPAGRHLQVLRSCADRYAGFNLLFGHLDELHYLSNRARARGPLAPGVYGLANGPLDAEWPKVVRAREALERLLDAPRIEARALLELLADRQPAAPAGPSMRRTDGFERLLSAPFVLHPEYGTRCSTIVLVDRHGQARFCERRFDAGGNAIGEATFEFHIEVGDAG